MRKRIRHLLTRWARRQTRQAQAFAAAQAHENIEARAARQRILTMATTPLPTIAPLSAPLLTRDLDPADRAARRIQRR